MEQIIRTITEFNDISVALRLLLALIMGGLIGVERGMHGRAAGMRTHVLVCLGACMTALVGIYILEYVDADQDVTRIAAQVISGIGFLGAGTIMVTKRNRIKGLTTAAGLWATAGLGLALGIGFYEVAFAGAFAILLVMTLMQRMDNFMRKRTTRLDVFVEINREYNLGDFLRQIRSLNIDAYNFQRERDSETQSEFRAYTVTLKLSKRRNHASVIEQIMQLPGVEYLEEL